MTIDVFHGRLQRRVRLEQARRPSNPLDAVPVLVPLGGKQSKIFECQSDPGVLCKIFEPTMRFEEIEKKLLILQGICANTPGVNPIVDLLYDHAGGEVIGYTMPELVKAPKLSQFQFNNHFERLAVALSLAKTCFALQSKGAGPADLHNENILMVKGMPTLIDVDSFFFLKRTFQGEALEHHLDLGTLEFTAREHMGKKDVIHTHQSAAFSLAVNLYQILKDRHPAELQNASGRVIPAADAINKGNYGQFRNPSNLQIIDDGIPWTEIPGNVTDLFEKNFIDGLTDPAQRPLAEEWATALEEWYATAYYVDRPKKARRPNLPPPSAVVRPGLSPRSYLVLGAAAGLIMSLAIVQGKGVQRQKTALYSPESEDVTPAPALVPEPEPVDPAEIWHRNQRAKERVREAKAEFLNEMTRRAQQWPQ